MNTRVPRAVAGIVLAGWVLVGCAQNAGPPGPAGSPAASQGVSEGVSEGGTRVTQSELCSAELEYADRHYVGHGDLVRDPVTTGRVETGAATGDDCDLSRQVEVAELADVSMNRAVLAEGTVYVRADRPFTEAARVWFEPVRCDSTRAFQVSGEWLGVRSRYEAGSDGDLRAPFSVEVHVLEGPGDYVGSRVRVRATEETDPTLGRDDVRDSLWEGGDVAAVVHCADGAFVATALTSSPG